MKNADYPAMPQTNADNLCMQTGASKIEHSGLTKREYFAGLAMQGLFVKDDIDINNAAIYAVVMADRLLEELERTK